VNVVGGIERRVLEVFGVADFEDGAEDYTCIVGGETGFPAPAADEAPAVFHVTATGWWGNESVEPVVWRELEQAFSEALLELHVHVGISLFAFRY
jgi:hypothetical protein